METIEPVIDGELAEVLMSISTGLGLVAERIFGIFVSAQVLMGILDIVAIALTLLGTCLAAKYAWSKCKKAFENESDGSMDVEAIAYAMFVSLCAATVASFVVAFTTKTINAAILKIVCPEYTAMIEIMNLVVP